MSTYAIYFSPTGGTEKICKGITKNIDGNFTAIELENVVSNKEFTKGDLVVLALPCFSGRVPAYCKEKLEMLEGIGANVVIISVFGNRDFDDELVEMEDIMKGKGFNIVAAGAFVAQHSITEKIGTGRPDERDYEDFERFANEVKTKLADANFDEFEIPGNRPYKEVGKSSFIPYGDDTCIYCNACVEDCPVNAIPEDNPIDTDPDICFSCMRCIVVCPVECRAIDPEKKEATTKRLSEIAGERKDNIWFK